nr:MAG TPA: hypothetical protein [Caudoviricetes sp.]
MQILVNPKNPVSELNGKTRKTGLKNYHCTIVFSVNHVPFADIILAEILLFPKIINMDDPSSKTHLIELVVLPFIPWMLFGNALLFSQG